MTEKSEELKDKDVITEEEPEAEIDNHSEEDEESDEEPEDISLKEGKRLAEEKQKLEKESTNTLQKLKKQKIKDREERNILQQQEKRKRKPDSIVPEKLGDDILTFVDEEVEINTEDIFCSRPTEPKNQKIIFNDHDDSEEDEGMGDSGSEEDSEASKPKQKKVITKCIKNVHKEENNSAREFLKNHFFGDRLKRDEGKVRFLEKNKMRKESKESTHPQLLKNRVGK